MRLEKAWGGLKPLGFVLRVDLAEGCRIRSAEGASMASHQFVALHHCSGRWVFRGVMDILIGAGHIEGMSDAAIRRVKKTSYRQE